ncbi:MAG: hypothetical protein R2784_15835 [Saprospiraceae bacterium]
MMVFLVLQMVLEGIGNGVDFEKRIANIYNNAVPLKKFSELLMNLART